MQTKKGKRKFKILKISFGKLFLIQVSYSKITVEVRAFIIIFIIIVENGLSVIDTSLLGTPV